MTITILQNGRLFDGFSDHLVDPCHVVVEDDRIREVAFKPISIENARRINCRGQTVMPGLIDAHVHACLPASDFDAVARMPPSLLSQYAGVALAGYLRRGFTTVRDACGADYGLVTRASSLDGTAPSDQRQGDLSDRGSRRRTSRRSDRHLSVRPLQSAHGDRGRRGRGSTCGA